MGSVRAKGGTDTTLTAAPRDAALDTVVSDEGAAERIYRECREGGLLLPVPGPVSIHRKPATASLAAADAERTVLAGSIAPAQRKAAPSMEVTELGRGGIGRVYVSIDMGLQREIAVKEILPELIEGDPEVVSSLRARFLREARVTGQLEHPNIVPVYEVGERDDGSLYYSMRVIRGQTLKQALDGTRSLAERLALLNHFLGLCNAIAYAHSRGVIHRDIKPQNVMLGEFGETVVLDWGVAKLKNAEEASHSAGAIREPSHEVPEQTRLGQVLGTPAYMAPEALLGHAEGVDERSDVWSLGVVLYLLLSGELPLRGSLASLVKRARSRSVRPLHPFDPEVPRELGAVAERALKQDPDARYQTAGEMARDIEAYLTGAKVGAYAYSSWELMRRFYHKQRATLLVAMVAILTLAILSVISYRRVLDARDRALSAESEQRKSALAARERLAQLLNESARFALQRRDMASAELLAARALTVKPDLEARGVILSLGASGQPMLSSSREFARHCVSAAYASQSRSVYCAAGQELLRVTDGKLTVLDRRPAVLTAVALTADAQQVYSGDRRGVLSLFRADKHVLDAPVRADRGAVTALGMSPQEQYLLVGYQAGRAEVRRAADLVVVQEFAFGEAVSSLAMSRRGALAVGGRLGALSVWPTLAADQPLRFQGHHGTLTALAYSPDASFLATGSSDQTVRLWLAADPLQHPSILRTGHVALGFAWSPDGHHLVYGTREHRVHWVDVRLGRTLSELPGHQQQVPLVAFSQDGAELISVDTQLGMRRWRVPQQRWRERLVEPGNVLVLEGGLGPERLVGAGLGSNGICLWDLTKGSCEVRLPFRTEQVRALALTADAGRLAAGGKRGELMVWDMRSRLPLAPLFGHVADVRALAFRQGDTQLISGDLDGRLILWDVPSAKLMADRRLSAGVGAVALSPDGQRLAVALRNEVVEIWDSQLTQRLTTLRGHRDWVMDVKYISNKRLVSAGADSDVVVWDVGRREPIRRFHAGEGRVLSVDVSGDGRWLIAGGEDGSLRVFDLDNLRLALTLRDHDAAVRSVRFLREGLHFASGSDDRSIRVWDLQRELSLSPEALLVAAETRYGIDADEVAFTK